MKIFLDDERVPVNGKEVLFFAFKGNFDFEFKSIGRVMSNIDFLISQVINFDFKTELPSRENSRIYEIEKLKLDSYDWVICRTVDDAITLVKLFGDLSFVSFDNDLQTDLEGVDFAKWLIQGDIDNGVLSADFNFTVHSQNSIAGPLIKSKLDQYLAYKNSSNDFGARL